MLEFADDRVVVRCLRMPAIVPGGGFANALQRRDGFGERVPTNGGCDREPGAQFRVGAAQRFFERRRVAAACPGHVERQVAALGDAKPFDEARRLAVGHRAESPQRAVPQLLTAFVHDALQQREIARSRCARARSNSKTAAARASSSPARCGRKSALDTGPALSWKDPSQSAQPRIVGRRVLMRSLCRSAASLRCRDGRRNGRDPHCRP